MVKRFQHTTSTSMFSAFQPVTLPSHDAINIRAVITVLTSLRRVTTNKRVSLSTRATRHLGTDALCPQLERLLIVTRGHACPFSRRD